MAKPQPFLVQLTRSCTSTLYKLDPESDGKRRSPLRWGLIRWMVIPFLILLILLAITVYTILAGDELREHKTVVATGGEAVAPLLDPKSTLSRLPGSLEEYKKNWTGRGIGEIRENSELENENGGVEPGNGLDEEEYGKWESRENETDLMYSDEESTFIDRLISSFREPGGRTPITVHQFNLQHPRLSNGHKYGEYQAMSKYLGYSTTALPVSPTLPSLPIRTQGSTTVQPSNQSDSWLCDSPRVGMCRGVVPWDLTTRPQLAATDEQSLAYFELVAASGCSARAAQFLCTLLEPECQPQGAPLLPPCRSICRAVAEDCSDLLLGGLDLSQVFNCENYPDSNNPSECVNLATGEGCFKNEMMCEDNSCIPLRWRCDGNKDCPLGRDEANCTSQTRCPENHFMCESMDKCVPLQWRCDGRSDCSDSSDEKGCQRTNYERMSHSHASPCPSGELRCLDGRCISPRQICDSTPDCSDAADELNCPAT